MLLAHGDPRAYFEELFATAHLLGPLVSLELDEHALGEFLDALEQTANSAQNHLAMDRLGVAFSRIEAGLDGSADPGWHKLRPALARLELSAQDGQHLAFISTYMRLHRQAPAEADMQDYFGISAPSAHSVFKRLERKGFIVRKPGVARSTRILLGPHEIPELE